MRNYQIFILIFFIFLIGLWIVTGPDNAITVGPPTSFGSTPDSVRAVETDYDYISKFGQKTALILPPYDEVLLNGAETIAYVTTIDGWFWKVDLVSGTAEPFVDTPLMPAGARFAPDDSQLIYFCASRLYGQEYPATDRVGLYKLDIGTKKITPIVLDLPISPETGGEPIVYSVESRPSLSTNMKLENTSRPLEFCNDLDISADGRRLYFTEPFSYGVPSMGGGGTFREALALAHNGRVWRHDLDTGETSLVAQNLIFPDGILVEENTKGREQSLLITETVNFRLLRLYMEGDRAGEIEPAIENLPGMPDGMDRDSMGRIWIGLLKQRSATIDKIHKNPWIKHILLRLPVGLMPVSSETSVLGLSKDGKTPIFYTLHDGSFTTDISAVIPGKKGLYLATVGLESKGLYSIPYPDNLVPK
jgi:sugar lactone lactonase YvrE